MDKAVHLILPREHMIDAWERGIRSPIFYDIIYDIGPSSSSTIGLLGSFSIFYMGPHCAPREDWARASEKPLRRPACRLAGSSEEVAISISDVLIKPPSTGSHAKDSLQIRD